MDERTLRKGLLQTLVMEMDRQELKRIPAYAEPEEEQAEGMAQKNAVDGAAKPDAIEVTADIQQETPSPAAVNDDEEKEKKMSKLGRGLKAQMDFAGSLKK